MSRADRIRAAESAADVLNDYEVDQNHPVDPFALIEAMGLTLSITKLDNLLGALVPSGNGGVLITSERPASVQRYTAAHEIGHWRLHRNYLMDTEDDIFSGAAPELEYEAQVFASYLLMPEPLFQDAVSRYRVRKGAVSPEQVYLLSRDLFVSFEAAARRLQTSHYITGPDLIALRNPGRLGALERVFGGLRPADGYADMWAVGFTGEEDTAFLTVGEHDEVVLTLPEHRLSGWRWLTTNQLQRRNEQSIRRERPRPASTAIEVPATIIERTQAPQWAVPVAKRPAELAAVLELLPEADSALRPGLVAEETSYDSMEVIADLFSGTAPTTNGRERRRLRKARIRGGDNPTLEIDDQIDVGGMGIRRLVLRCNDDGDWSLQLHYAHAYDSQIDPISEFRVEVNVQPTPTHAFRRKLLRSDFDARLPGDPDDDAVFEVVAS